MEKIEWCVDYEWEYDLDRLVDETQTFMNEWKDLSVEEVARKVIHHLLTFENYNIYFAFGEEQYEIIINEILQELKIQQTLF